ncbi:MAG: PilN domain-containing protein [Elusimicrobia bacterium]|nr:PilN domain-containing protein [Elusimicrobiota bacterium]
MIRVNLVPRELLDKEVQRQRMTQAAVVGAIGLVIVLFLSAAHWYRATKTEGELAELNKKYDKLAKIVAQVEELEKTANAVKIRLGVINGLLKGRALYPWFMTDLQSTLPPGVWMTSLTTAAKEPNGLTVTIGNATANSSDGVSQWLRNFAASGKFAEPKLSAIAVTDKGDSKEYSFSIGTIYENPRLK